jgi:gliding motility-associated lipoprotein GldH
MNPNKHIVILFPFLWIAILVASCNFDSLFEKTQDISKNKWDKNQIVRFDVNVKDTIHGYNIFVNVRNSSDYSYKNLFLFINTTSPNGFTKRDTVELTLADDKGKWLGTGIGGVNNIEKTYKKNVRFPVSGNYKIELFQAMRNDILEGIMDVGIRIEKIK